MSDPQPTNPIELFYSYSNKDEKLREKLETHLALLKRQDVIAGWHDRKIGAGQEWANQIDEHLNSAQIVLLLVSADFVASDYCYDVELKRAMERHETGEARVIPIILRPCDWHSAPFGKLQALPKDARPVVSWQSRDEAYLDIAQGIRRVAEAATNPLGQTGQQSLFSPTYALIIEEASVNQGRRRPFKVLRDKISLIKPNGDRFDNIECDFGADGILIPIRNLSVAIEAGDTLERATAFNKTEQYTVIDPGYEPGIHNEPAYRVKAKKEMAASGASKPMPNSVSTTKVDRMSKIKVLFLSANPTGSPPLALDEEIREITNKIRAAEHRDAIELISRWAVRPDDLLQALNEHKPHIVHFSGHGSPTDEIILLDNNGNSKPVSKAALESLFRTLKDNVQIVVLNACYSKTQAEAITQVIDCAIGMNKAIGDKAAITFAASFYRAIGFGRSVQEAFDQGKTALLLEGIPEDRTPELLVHQNVDASQVLPVGSNIANPP